jgi:hypothetical protein
MGMKLFHCTFAGSILILTLCVNLSFAINKCGITSNNLKVLDLKCEYASNPIGMDVQSPQLNWRIESTENRLITDRKSNLYFGCIPSLMV